MRKWCALFRPFRARPRPDRQVRNRRVDCGWRDSTEAGDGRTGDSGYGGTALAACRYPVEASRQSPGYSLDVEGESLQVGVVSMGNPHLVWRVDDIDSAPVERLGPVLERHPRFPRRVNVGFMQVVARDAIRLRVFERGVGETLACGTGACAAVVVGRVQGLLDARARVSLRGGELDIYWAGEGAPVLMTGPAVTVFEGSITL